jgi:tetratricopeptide (TPR) repeat protein
VIADDSGSSRQLPIRIELEEGAYRYNSNGTKSYSYYRRYRILTKEGLGWNYVSANWSAWFQKKPEIWAKVTSPDGKETVLDQKTIGEVAEKQENSLIYSDHHTLRAPLPAITVGSMVEEKITLEDYAPFFSEGSHQFYRISERLPIAHSAVTIDLPEGIPFQYIVHNYDCEPVLSKNPGRLIYKFELKNIPAQEENPRYAPSNYLSGVAIEFSTARGWNEVVNGYYSMIRHQLVASPALKEFIGQVKKGPDDLSTIKNCVSILHENIRYTGVEFADASIIPRKPEEVLSRKYGDCKDKAALLICMLAEFGIKADIALLYASTGLDMNKDMPGIEIFNHAIVYVPSQKIWIDATADLVPVGELPNLDQDRYALVISPETSSLIKTPSRDQTRNRTMITREISMAQLGPSSMSEKSTYCGRPADDIRSFFLGKPEREINERMKEYVSKNLKSDKMTSFTHSEPRSLYDPFQYSINIASSAYYQTNTEDAFTHLEVSKLLGDLPDDITNFENFNGSEENDGSPWKNRKIDVVLPLPHSYSLKYRVKIPPGFEVLELPENETKKAGTAVFTKSYSLKNESIEASFDFSTGSGVFNPEEFKSFRKLLFDIINNRFSTVTYASSPFRHFEKGEVVASVKLLRSLIDKYPTEPGNYIRLGNILLSSGLRDAAISYIDQAIALNNRSEEANLSLGWTRLHDPYGRKMKGQIDIDGAIKAYEKVITLNDKNELALKNLAILAEYDKQGNRYGSDADILKAADLYKRYKDTLKNNELDYNYALVFFYLGKYDEVVKLDKLDLNERYNAAIFLSSTAVVNGLPALWKKLDSITTDGSKKEEILESAVHNLCNARRYDLASEILGRLSSFSKNAMKVQSQNAYIKKLKRWESIIVPKGKPEQTVYDFYKYVYYSGLTQRDAGELFAGGYEDQVSNDEIVKKYKTIRQNFIRYITDEQNRLDYFFDTIYSNLSLVVEGDDTLGYRIKTSCELPERTVTSTFYCVKDRGSYKLIYTPAALPNLLGRIALSHLDRKDTANAQKILKWVYESAEQIPSNTYEIHQFFSLWNKGITETDIIRLSALSLLSLNENHITEINRILNRVKDKNILIQAYRTLYNYYNVKKEYARAFENVRKIVELGETDIIIMRSYYDLLNKTGKSAECYDLVMQEYKKNKNNADYVYLAAFYEIERGNYAKAGNILKDAANRNVGSANTYNLLAWLGLYIDEPLQTCLDYSLKGNNMSNFNVHAHLHTLATIYSDMGKVPEAQQVIAKILDNSGESEVNMVDYYILGRNAETLGLINMAREYYKKIANSEESKHLSAWELAHKRLKKIEIQK